MLNPSTFAAPSFERPTIVSRHHTDGRFAVAVIGRTDAGGLHLLVTDMMDARTQVVVTLTADNLAQLSAIAATPR